jgi:hypothetical protein
MDQVLKSLRIIIGSRVTIKRNHMILDIMDVSLKTLSLERSCSLFLSDLIIAYLRGYLFFPQEKIRLINQIMF